MENGISQIVIQYVADISQLQQAAPQIGAALTDAANKGKTAMDAYNDSLKNTSDLIGDLATELKQTAALSGMDKAIGSMQSYGNELQKAADKQASLTDKIEQNIQVLAELKKAGEDGSSAFKTLLNNTADLTKQLKAAREQVQHASKDFMGLKAAGEGIKAISDGMESALKVSTQLGFKNEELEKGLQKLKSAMSVVDGVAQAGNKLKEVVSLPAKLAESAAKALTTVETLWSESSALAVGAATGGIAIFVGLLTGAVAWLIKVNDQEEKHKRLEAELSNQYSDQASALQRVKDLQSARGLPMGQVDINAAVNDILEQRRKNDLLAQEASNGNYKTVDDFQNSLDRLKREGENPYDFNYKKENLDNFYKGLNDLKNAQKQYDIVMQKIDDDAHERQRKMEEMKLQGNKEQTAADLENLILDRKQKEEQAQLSGQDRVKFEEETFKQVKALRDKAFSQEIQDYQMHRDKERSDYVKSIGIDTNNLQGFTPEQNQGLTLYDNETEATKNRMRADYREQENNELKSHIQEQLTLIAANYQQQINIEESSGKNTLKLQQQMYQEQLDYLDKHGKGMQQEATAIANQLREVNVQILSNASKGPPAEPIELGSSTNPANLEIQPATNTHDIQPNPLPATPSDNHGKKLKQQLQDYAKLADDLAKGVASFTDQIFARQLQNLQQQFVYATSELERWHSRATELAGDNARKQAAVQRLYTEEQTALAHEQAIKEAELKRKQAEMNKATSLIQVAINTAEGISAAMLLPPPVDYVKVAEVIATGVTSAATIAAQPLPAIPKFAKGIVKFQGQGTDISDSNLVAISKNESIISAAATHKYEQELNAINSMKFEQLILEKYLKPALINASPNVNVNVETDMHPVKQEIKTTNKLLKRMMEKMDKGSGLYMHKRYEA